MDELEKLEYLSLVSKICTELDNHLGLNDKDLAEFIIDLAKKNETFETFKSALANNGAKFDDSFIANLLRLIHHMQPKKKKVSDEPNKTKDADYFEDLNSESKEVLKQKIPGLAIPDQPEAAGKLLEELEGLIPKWKEEQKTEEKTSPRRRRRSRSDSRDRQRRRHRSSSRDRHRRRRSRSPDGRSGRSDRRRRSRSRSPGRRRDRRDRERELPEEPSVGEIYEGRGD